MLRTRFWPITARPIRPMSQLSFCIASPDEFLPAPLESLFYSLRGAGRPLRAPLLPERADTLGEIGRAKQLPPEPLRHLSGLTQIESATFGDEAEPAAHGFRARGGDSRRDLAGSRFQLSG